MRGGNTRHTRNLRAMHDEPTDVLTDRYSFEEYFDDLMRVTNGVTNQKLAEIALRGLAEPAGVRFQPALSGTLNLGRTNAFFLGGGRTLNQLCHYAEGDGICLVYETKVEAVLMEDGFCEEVQVSTNGAEYTLQARSVIFSSGGFEANLDWLAEGWARRQKTFCPRHAL